MVLWYVCEKGCAQVWLTSPCHRIGTRLTDRYGARGNLRESAVAIIHMQLIFAPFIIRIARRVSLSCPPSCPLSAASWRHPAVADEHIRKAVILHRPMRHSSYQ